MERNYLSEPDQVELIKGVGGSLRRLTGAGVGLVVITNQSGVGRGYFTEEAVHRVHERIIALLNAEGVVLDGIYFCPHAPAAQCTCRKPARGLVDQAVKDIGIVPAASFVIGDSRADIELGQRVGATTVLVRTGHGEEAALDASLKPTYVAADLPEAAGLIIGILAHWDS